MERVSPIEGFSGVSGLSAWLDALVEFAGGSHRRAALALVVFALLCFLPGIVALPPTDRDESRFAQASKQMLESGDHIDIRFQDVARHKKPVGIYWLQAASVAAAERLGVSNARTRIVFYRFPSLIGAIGAVLVTYWAALAFVARRYALLAALMMAASVLLGFEARIAKTDAAMLLTAVAAFGALGRVYMAARASPERTSTHPWAIAGIFWTALAGSILLKGPIVALFLTLTVVALAIADRSVRWLFGLRPLPGIAWMLLLVLPWYVAVTLRSEGAFFEGSVGRDLLSKILTGQESHGAPPGYYFLLFWVTFWPTAPLAIMAAPFAWRARSEPAVRFLLAWLVPGWLLFELLITKLPHYVLPAYPAVAILIALALERCVPLNRYVRIVGWGWPLFALGVLAIGIALVVGLGGRFGFAFWPCAVAAILLAALAAFRLAADQTERALLLALAAAVATSAALFTVVSRAQDIFLAPRLVAMARTAPCPSPAIASAGFHEPSLVFLAGTAARLTNTTGAADFLRQGGCKVAMVDQREEPRFDERARETGLLYARIGEVRGVNYSNGRRITILVLTRKNGE